ncbi:short-chain dehydrogenase [Vibrio sp. 10N.286.49.C2]|uniref:SDR family NAD(P)-dependent oxidoreductase n=1 Tax=unclassified Vibrio TaxID=2614977 RepID=UPI000C83A6F1|nr:MULTISPECIES: SDR family NAD(P)-dependent oxidoreductase [unclassified Vibrio]PMH33705.1 short-chain dehydrogenase [Vibrio sp. 10N.286.49.C2]PMH43962.1 short-chain dehydrogenase [Vibrio sp. 10N.286.49.B1]PMH78575.1 short-chain dehydrogenase [Vibrio sp. 10N.286.48.B7]
METNTKAVFITGASSGIGRQLAEDYATQGYDVFACGRSILKLEELKASRDNIHLLSFDVTNKDDVDLAIRSLPTMPALWIINAGDCEYVDDGQLDSNVLKRVFDVNVFGVVHVLESIQSHLTPEHHIVVVGSIASELALPRAEAYGASKAAVSYLVRTLQLDWQANGALVTCVYPGFVRTPLTDKNDFDMPMMIEVEEASNSIRKGIEAKQSHIYFPTKFVSIIRLIALLPYRWQRYLVNKMVNR